MRNSYNRWFKKQDSKQDHPHLDKNPLISLIVPAYNTPENFFLEMIESVSNQWYENWELCIADGSDSDFNLKKILADNNYLDNRVIYKKLNKNLGISKNTNEAIKLCNGEYIALFDHDDLLTKDALYCFAEYMQNNYPDCLYSDEDIISEDSSQVMGPNFKPDWSPDLFYSHNYITHLFMVKKSVVDKVGGFRSEYDGAQDYDFIGRCISASNEIVHVPKVLYHWRAHPESTAGDSSSKLYAYENGAKVVKNLLKVQNIDANVSKATDVLGFYRYSYKINPEPLVTVVLDDYSHKDKYSVDFCNLIDYKNIEFADSPSNAKGEYILFLNHYIKPINSNALSELVGVCSRQDVAAVTGKVLNEENKIIHAGFILDKKHFARSVFYGEDDNSHAYMTRPLLTCNYSAVSSDCLLVKKALFDKVNGFGDIFSSTVRDVNLCLKLRKLNKYISYNGHSKWCAVSKIRHDKLKKKDIDECKSRWTDVFKYGDPFYNKNFNVSKDLFKL